MRTALSFDDVLLVPGYNDLPSRSMVSLASSVGKVTLTIPIVASNMPSVCEADMARAMANLGGLGIIHRMQSIKDQCFQVTLTDDLVGAAIGIGEDWKERASALIEAGANPICLDVAHGHQKKVLDVAVEFLDDYRDISFIVGNIATGYAAKRFSREISKKDHNRVILKVGVGGGSVCTTRVRTGFGVPTLESVLDISMVLKEEGSLLSIMADGGIRNSGDIVKAIAAGADTVMLGSLLSGTSEAPGDVIKDDKTGLKYKIYRGAASYGAKKAYFGEAEYIEGAERLVPYKGSVEKTIVSLLDGMRSGLTYCGVRNFASLKKNAEFIRITESGLRESLPHGIFQ